MVLHIKQLRLWTTKILRIQYEKKTQRNWIKNDTGEVGLLRGGCIEGEMDKKDVLMAKTEETLVFNKKMCWIMM